MAGKGPPRAPQAVLEARNSWRAASRKKEGVLEVEKSIPETPQKLKDDALAVFNKLCSMLSDMGVIHRADEFAMHRYSMTYVRWCNLSDKNPAETISKKTFDKKGNLVSSTSVINPKVRVLSMLNGELLQLERQFGLTPSARAYLKPNDNQKPKAQDPKDRFFTA